MSYEEKDKQDVVTDIDHILRNAAELAITRVKQLEKELGDAQSILAAEQRWRKVDWEHAEILKKALEGIKSEMDLGECHIIASEALCAWK